MLDRLRLLMRPYSITPALPGAEAIGVAAQLHAYLLSSSHVLHDLPCESHSWILKDTTSVRPVKAVSKLPISNAIRDEIEALLSPARPSSPCGQHGYIRRPLQSGRVLRRADGNLQDLYSVRM
jgi:hypothetical protein